MFRNKVFFGCFCLFISCLFLTDFCVNYVFAKNKESEGNKHKWSISFFKKKNPVIDGLRFKDFFVYSQKARERKKLNEYKSYFEEEYKNRGDVFSVAIQYGLVLIELGDLDKAYQVFEKGVNDFAQNPAPVVYKGWILGAQGHSLSAKKLLYPIAKEKIDQGISGFMSGLWLPYHVDAVVGLALIRDYLPDDDKQEVDNLFSQKFYDKTILDFKSQPKLTACAVAKDLQQGNISKAESKLAEALKLHPEDHILLTLQGSVKYSKGDYEGAKELLEKANAINPDSPTNNLLLARTLYALGNKEEAINKVNLALELDPKWEFASEVKDLLVTQRKGVLSVFSGFFKERKEN